MYFCVDPPATTLFAAIFLHEQIHTTQVVGSALILFGMWVTIKHGEEGEVVEDGKKALEDDAHVGSINALSTSNPLKLEEQPEFGGEEGEDDVGETVSLLSHKSD